uniref:Uncharacterized protein n=1 Tax=Rhizophagus irregularis (strain DAOM 181602 / DAOM 197198 / MUCL 43194) TaxID=747089 RepID=U9U5I9_RHIID
MVDIADKYYKLVKSMEDMGLSILSTVDTQPVLEIQDDFYTCRVHIVHKWDLLLQNFVPIIIIRLISLILSMEVPMYASKYRINLSLDHLTDRNSALILAWTESGKG